MNKKYTEIDFCPGTNIEECVNELLKYKEKGQLVFGNFNGHKLYSDTITMDGAYKEVLGNTKEEFDKEIQKQNEEYQRQKREHQANIPDLTRFWIEKGREVLDKSKWEFWDTIVPIRLNDLYRGMELKYCLDIIEILNKVTFEEAKREIENQGHSGMSFGLVLSMVKEFSPLGEEFFNYIS